MGATFEDALAAALKHAEETGATFVHPYEDERVIAGQGTIGLELAEQVPQAGTVVIPVGGGGLSSGIALALRAVRPDVRIVGVQAGLSGPTIADGIAVKHVGVKTSAILEDVLDDLISVGDDEICRAIVLLLERTKLVVEGAGAVGVAALLTGQGRRRGPGGRDPLRRQHRPDRADLGDAARADRRPAATSSCAAGWTTGPAS